MAEIKNYDNHSTIQIKKDIHFVFGSLENDGEPIERIKSSIDEFKKYFSVIGEEAPDVVMAWKTAKEGDWVMSDDYRVLQILKRTDNPDPNGYNSAIIRTCVGTFAVNPKTFFDSDFNLHPDRYRVSSTGQDAASRIVGRDKITNNERMFGNRVSKGQDPVDAYMSTFPTESKSYAKDMSKMLLKQERIQKHISSEVETILTEEGVSKRYIIQNYKQLIDDGLADLRYCSGSVVRALDSLVKMSGMNPDETKSSQSMGVLQEVDDDLLGSIENAEYSVMENGKDADDEDFQQEFLEEPKEMLTEKHFEKVGDNLLTRTGLDLLS